MICCCACSRLRRACLVTDSEVADEPEMVKRAMATTGQHPRFLGGRLLYVRKAKGGRQRVVPIHPAFAPLFAAYYATRVPLIEPALFVGVHGKPLNYTSSARSSAITSPRRASASASA